MRRLLFMLVLAAIPISSAQSSPYEASWTSLKTHGEAPQWLQDAKFGIYFHWGIYTVPAYSNAWYGYSMYRPNDPVSKYHREKYGTNFHYHDFVPLFKAERFDPASWADLFAEAGARFAGPVGMHHDGFAMWDSDITPWNVADMGPKRDITGELLHELNQRGLKTIITLHHARHLQRNAHQPHHWASGSHPNPGADSHFIYDPKLITSTTDPLLRQLYGNFEKKEGEQRWLALCKEAIDKYSPDILWFDSWLGSIPATDRQEMAAYYYNQASIKKQEVTLAYKQNDLAEGVGIEDIEQGGKMQRSKSPWLTDVTLGYNTWSYVEGQTYKPSELVLRNMIDVWSKNGIVLLNLSPRADGTICEQQRKILKEIGAWLQQYGEAVYATHAFTVFGYGPTAPKPGYFGGQSATMQYTAEDVRFTLSADEKSFYMICLGSPKAGAVYDVAPLHSYNYNLPSPIKHATLLGTDTEVKVEVDQATFNVTMPDAPMNPMATVIKFELY